MTKLTLVERNAILTASKVGPKNFDAIARMNGITQEMAREVVRQALGKLGASFDDYEGRTPCKSDPVSIPELRQKVGLSQYWVTSHLTAFEHLSRMSDLHGRNQRLYEPIVLKRLIQVWYNQPDSSWVSVNGAAKLLGCSWIWAGLRIGRYRNLKATRQFCGREVDVYPPEILWPLSLELKATKRRTGAWLTLPELSRRLGRSRAWIAKQLKKLGIEPERRPTHNGRMVPHYPPEAEFALRRIDRALERAGDQLTTAQVAIEAGVAYATAKKRLAELNITPRRLLTAKSNQPIKHWRREVVALVAQRPHDPDKRRRPRVGAAA